MGDPFSVAGSAVGVVSLGLSVCQGLLAYYGPFKSFHGEINDSISEVENLDNILRVLKNTLMTDLLHASPTAESTKTVTDTISGCQKKLRELEIMLEKCRGAPLSSLSVRRISKARLFYPFRRDTLKALMETVGGLKSTLNNALNSLQM
jgi:hypothetical protein